MTTKEINKLISDVLKGIKVNICKINFDSENFIDDILTEIEEALKLFSEKMQEENIDERERINKFTKHYADIIEENRDLQKQNKDFSLAVKNTIDEISDYYGKEFSSTGAINIIEKNMEKWINHSQSEQSENEEAHNSSKIDGATIDKNVNFPLAVEEINKGCGVQFVLLKRNLYNDDVYIKCNKLDLCPRCKKLKQLLQPLKEILK